MLRTLGGSELSLAVFLGCCSHFKSLLNSVGILGGTTLGLHGQMPIFSKKNHTVALVKDPGMCYELKEAQLLDTITKSL